MKYVALMARFINYFHYIVLLLFANDNAIHYFYEREAFIQVIIIMVK